MLLRIQYDNPNVCLVNVIIVGKKKTRSTNAGTCKVLDLVYLSYIVICSTILLGIEKGEYNEQESDRRDRNAIQLNLIGNKLIFLFLLTPFCYYSGTGGSGTFHCILG